MVASPAYQEEAVVTTSSAAEVVACYTEAFEVASAEEHSIEEGLDYSAVVGQECLAADHLSLQEAVVQIAGTAVVLHFVAEA